MNRSFSGYYPNDVCGVVYQNAHRHLGLPVHLRMRRHSGRGHRSGFMVARPAHARETLDGKLWLPEIAKSTHYHASYVSPYWVRAMKKNSKIGLHHFYRPRKWGTGDEAPSWGSAAYTADAAAKM
jgi:spore germination cell wall hydrolase CwlJ-like protein